MYVCYLCNYLLLETGEALHLNKLESPSPEDALCQVWLKLAQWFWIRRCLNFVNELSLFRNYFPFEKGAALHLNELEFPSPKDAWCKVWLKWAQWFWRRRFFNFVNVFSLFRNYLPLEKGGALHLNKLESPLPKDALCQVWLKLAQRFWRRRWKCEKFTTTTTTTDNGQILIRKAHLSLRLRWAKKDTENQPLKVYIQSEHEIRIISEQFDVCMIKSLGFATTLGDNLNVNSQKKIKKCFLIKTEACIPFT